jgi:hypothetical protein
VFEIGNSLREARLRRKIDYPEAEQATKIRAKYLRALEDEAFDLLPAPTYVKGFLRTYADYLGLEGQLYVDEYASRFLADLSELPVRARPSVPDPRLRRLESNVVLIGLLAIGLVAALVIAAWKFGGSPAKSGAGGLANAPVVVKHARTTTRKVPRHVAPAPVPARLVLTAAGGDCWLTVRSGSAAGRVVWEGTLSDGKSIRLTARRLFVLAGAPGNLGLVLNGNRVTLVPTSTPYAFVATSRGVATARA